MRFPKRKAGFAQGISPCGRNDNTVLDFSFVSHRFLSACLYRNEQKGVWG
jgi:hypothetical protein